MPLSAKITLVIRSAVMIACWALIADSLAYADSPAASPLPSLTTSPPANSDSASTGDLKAQIAAQIGALLPESARLLDLKLSCPSINGATLVAVAPGISRLTSSGVMIELQHDGKTEGCEATVSAIRQVMAAAHDIALGAPVSVTDIVSLDVDAFTGAPGAISSFDGTNPMVASTAIRAGQPIYQAQLTRPLAIRSGDQVAVSIIDGDVTLKTFLESRANGSIGDVITMVNADSGTSVSVKVTGPGEGELELR